MLFKFMYDTVQYRAAVDFIYKNNTSLRSYTKDDVDQSLRRLIKSMYPAIKREYAKTKSIIGYYASTAGFGFFVSVEDVLKPDSDGVIDVYLGIYVDPAVDDEFNTITRYRQLTE